MPVDVRGYMSEVALLLASNVVLCAIENAKRHALMVPVETILPPIGNKGMFLTTDSSSLFHARCVNRNNVDLDG